jgi:uncharacterized protein YbgA (DUF1722 family)
LTEKPFLLDLHEKKQRKKLRKLMDKYREGEESDTPSLDIVAGKKRKR